MSQSLVVAGFDIDGVLADFAAWSLAQLGLDPARNTEWGFERTYGPAADQALTRLVNDPATWVSLPACDGAKEALNRVQRAGVPIILISAMPIIFLPLRHWWLRRHFPATPLLLYWAKGAEKPALARRHGVTHFLEDKPTTAEAMATAGIHSYLVPTRYMGTPSAQVTVATVREYAHAVVRAAQADQPLFSGPASSYPNSNITGN